MALKRRSKAASDDFFPGFTEIVEIGVGSLSTVYRARELGTDRYVALKLLNVRDASPRALESFERESVALGAVSSHPNIVTLYRTFRADDGRPVLVLELCTGSVAPRAQGGPGVPPARVVALGIKIAGALETAHRAEILHRDVKPQNILVTEYGEPALADFGVAMLQSSTQTTAGLFDFTTLHAAPELLEGRATSPATDVYELASTLYQLVAGRSAFRAYDGESPASVILRILRDPVQPIGAPAVPSQLSDLLLLAMSKNKEQRPPTAAEFAAELAGIEVDQGWPRTQFVIRDPGSPGRGFAGPPVARRVPEAAHRAAVPVPDRVVAVPGGSSVPQPQQPAPVSQRPSTVTVPRYSAPASQAAPPSPPAPPPVPPPPVPPPPVPPPATSQQPTPSQQPTTRTVPVLPDQVADRTTWRPPPPLAAAPAEVSRHAAPEAIDDTPVPDDEWSVPTLTRHHDQPDPEPEPEPDSAPAEVIAPGATSPDPTTAESTTPGPRHLVLEHQVVERVVVDVPPPPEALPPEPLPPEPLPPAEGQTEGDPAAALLGIWTAVPDLSPPPPRASVPSGTNGGQPEQPAGPLPLVPWRDAGYGDSDDPVSTTPAEPPSDVDPDRTGERRYAVPPAGTAVQPAATAVPTWAFRVPPAPQQQTRFIDLRLDPGSLSPSVTIRSGAARLVVDERRLRSRSWLRRTELPWSDVLAFEARFESDAPGSAGRLVALTHAGPVELPATRRPVGDLRYVHALLDAYRERAAITGHL